MEAVRFWIQKTKEELRQEEREREVEKMFKLIFGFEPDRMIWSNSGLVARKVVSTIKEEFYIIGYKVWEIEFRLKEVDTINLDADWKFNQEEEENRIFYTWTKRLGKFEACVEIKTIK